jgi:hypothetical protein
MENEVKIFFNVDDLLEEHDCQNWGEFRSFVQFATDDVSDVGFLGGTEETDTFHSEDLSEQNGIYFLTEDGVSSVLYFPFTFDDLNEEIEKMGIFRN